jgi:glycosyltransferase involved in cell wall biosynthesis
LQVTLLAAPLPRPDYLAALAAADIAILLPHAAEGFYLPALEAMALGCATVVPDCIGNRAYVEPGRNALVPGHDLESLLAAVERLRDAGLRTCLREAGIATASRFGQARERRAFHAVLDDLPALWAAA